MLALAWIDLLLVQTVIVLLVWAAVSDAASFRIPNRITAAIVLLYPAHVLAAPQPIEWLGACGIAAGVFALGILAFARGWFGGGDVKLFAAASLWAGPAMFPSMLLVTGLTGGLLGILALLWSRFGWMLPYRFAAGPASAGEVERRPSFRTHVPYGVAIAAGGVAALLPLLAR